MGSVLGLSSCLDYRCAMFAGPRRGRCRPQGARLLRPLPGGAGAAVSALAGPPGGGAPALIASLPALRRELRCLLRALQPRGPVSRGRCGGSAAEHGAPVPHAADPEPFAPPPPAAPASCPSRSSPSVRICPLLGFLDPPARASGAWRIRGHGRRRPSLLRRLRRAHLRRVPVPEPRLPGRGGVEPGGARRGRLLPVRPGGDGRSVRACGAGRRSRRGRACGRSPVDLDHEPFRRSLHALLFSLKEELAPGSEGLFAAFRRRAGEAGRAAPRRDAAHPPSGS